MSQVIFRSATTANAPVEVIAGYDPPMREYFLTVFAVGPVGDEIVLYSSVDDPSDADQLGTDRLQAKLDALGIACPPDFWDRVAPKTGNFVTKYPPGWREA